MMECAAQDVCEHWVYKIGGHTVNRGLRLIANEELVMWIEPMTLISEAKNYLDVINDLDSNQKQEYMHPLVVSLDTHYCQKLIKEMKCYTRQHSKVGAEYELCSWLEDMKSHWELLQTLILEKIRGEVISEGRERISFWVAKEYVFLLKICEATNCYCTPSCQTRGLPQVFTFPKQCNCCNRWGTHTCIPT